MGFKWSLGVNEDVITEYGGVKLKDFLSKPAVVVDATTRAREKMSGIFGEDLIHGPHATSHSFLESEALGARMFWPEDSWPAPVGTLLSEPEDLDKLELVTDFMSRPNTQILRDMRSYLQEKVAPEAGYLQEGMIGNGHITTARNLRGDQIFVDLYERPEWCHRLFEFLTENHILCTQDLWKYQGIEQPGFFHIADDFAGMISPELFKEFVIPYWKRSFKVLGRGCGEVQLHSEVMHREHLPLLSKLPITIVDYGQDPYVTPKDALNSGFKTSWHFKDIELLNGTPESIKALYISYAESGLEGIRLSLLHRGVPVENVKALLAIARECGKDVGNR